MKIEIKKVKARTSGNSISLPIPNKIYKELPHYFLVDIKMENIKEREKEIKYARRR